MRYRPGVGLSPSTLSWAASIATNVKATEIRSSCGRPFRKRHSTLHPKNCVGLLGATYRGFIAGKGGSENNFRI
jgi:hypothetical protein